MLNKIFTVSGLYFHLLQYDFKTLTSVSLPGVTGSVLGLVDLVSVYFYLSVAARTIASADLLLRHTLDEAGALGT